MDPCLGLLGTLRMNSTRLEGDLHQESFFFCWEPHARLNPKTPGSCPKPKAQLLSQPGIPMLYISINIIALCPRTQLCYVETVWFLGGFCFYD